MQARCNTRSIFCVAFKRLEFSFPSSTWVAIARLKSTVCAIILPIAEGRIVGFRLFPMVSVLCET